MKKLSKVFGIISWLPDKIDDRKLREERLNRLLKQLNKIWPDIPCLIIAQNWQDFKPEVINEHSIIDRYDQLGILLARKTLRYTFLDEFDFDYIIMFDDDAIIKMSEPGKADEYMEMLDKNPEGFCFIPGKDPNGYADSQLNLCAISRYIYEKEDLPDFDPQKNEAFEDRIYSCLLHNKYAKNEFKPPVGIRCNHFHNAEEKAPSTWTNLNGKKKWNVLSENTQRIEEFIRFNKELPDRRILSMTENYGDIDLVVPYVDSTDANWQKLFLKYNPIKEQEIEGINATNRFRGQGEFFRYFFRAIDKNIPYVRTIHLIVQSESQVPEWINREKVHIVYHEDFIPKEYLPIFNSTAIETFIPFIPGLAEKFLYANDDLFAYNFIDETRFYDEYNLPRLSTGLNRQLYTMYGHHMANSFALIYDVDVNKILAEDQVAAPGHKIRPYLKSKCLEAFLKYKKELLSRVSQFREEKNVNMYFYDHYLIKNGYQAASNGLTATIIDSGTNLQDMMRRISREPHILAIQDTREDIDVYKDSTLLTLFNEKFNHKCKYEKDGHSYVTTKIDRKTEEPSFNFVRMPDGSSWIM